MHDLYSSEGPLRFCQLTLMMSESDKVKRIQLWLGRVMDADCYDYYEDHSVGCHIWSFCMTDYERKQFAAYLMENNFVDFVLEVKKGNKTHTLSATSEN